MHITCGESNGSLAIRLARIPNSTPTAHTPRLSFPPALSLTHKAGEASSSSVCRVSDRICARVEHSIERARPDESERLPESTPTTATSSSPHPHLSWTAHREQRWYTDEPFLLIHSREGQAGCCSGRESLGPAFSPLSAAAIERALSSLSRSTDRRPALALVFICLSQAAKAAGCHNILALRGDPPAGSSTWTPVPTGFTTAAELVRYIRSKYGDYFCISVAGFPGLHPETPDTPEGRAQEMVWLKEKIDAGAEFIFTQMFYDAQLFLDWVKRVRAAGITVPIVPGIMPIQSWATFEKWVARENITVPQHFYDALNPIKDDDARVREVGTKLVGEMCKILLAEPGAISGLHIYTLNLQVGARMLLEEVGLGPSVPDVSPMPWTPSLTPNRRTETIRPIVSVARTQTSAVVPHRPCSPLLRLPSFQFWANRQKSYLSRSESPVVLVVCSPFGPSDARFLPSLPSLLAENWDEFPNGRWGDSRSPAYGEFDGYLLPQLKLSKDQAYELWGKPETIADVRTLFSKFCMNELVSRTILTHQSYIFFQSSDISLAPFVRRAGLASVVRHCAVQGDEHH